MELVAEQQPAQDDKPGDHVGGDGGGAGGAASHSHPLIPKHSQLTIYKSQNFNWILNIISVRLLLQRHLLANRALAYILYISMKNKSNEIHIYNLDQHTFVVLSQTLFKENLSLRISTLFIFFDQKRSN